MVPPQRNQAPPRPGDQVPTWLAPHVSPPCPSKTSPLVISLHFLLFLPHPLRPGFLPPSTRTLTEGSGGPTLQNPPPVFRPHLPRGWCSHSGALLLRETPSWFGIRLPVTWFPPGAAGPASSAFPGAPQAPRVCSSSASPCVVGTGDRLHAPLAPQAGPQTVQSAPTLVIRHTPPPACLPHLLVGPESCTCTPARPRPGPYQWCPARLSQEPPSWSPGCQLFPSNVCQCVPVKVPISSPSCF